MSLITEEQFKQICPKIHNTRATILVNLINKICPAYGIVNADIFHEFFANLCEESACFSRYEESLFYSSADRLVEVWPKRFPTTLHAQQYVRHPKELAMYVYGKRADLGNLSAEDGWDFRGSGPIQMTGRGIITSFAEYMKTHHTVSMNPMAWAATLRTSDEYGLHSACWLFAIAKKLIQLAIDDKFKEIVLRINGGYTNLSQRTRYYEKIKQLIPV